MTWAQIFQIGWAVGIVLAALFQNHSPRKPYLRYKGHQ